MARHCQEVHKNPITEVPNALPGELSFWLARRRYQRQFLQFMRQFTLFHAVIGRDNVKINIYGMAGVPSDVLLEWGVPDSGKRSRVEGAQAQPPQQGIPPQLGMYGPPGMAMPRMGMMPGFYPGAYGCVKQPFCTP